MVEVFKNADGRYSWRVRDAAGRIVPITPGKAMLPAGSAAANRRSRAAVQKVLAERFKAQTGEA